MPPGTIHLPDWVESEWLKQFVAEQLVTVKTRRGFARLEWQKLRERNEALDARVYARAAAWIAGLDRWSEASWTEAEREVRVERDPASRPHRSVPPSSSSSPDGWLARRRGWLR
jgi:phage terminase large subunit GpA-like protein